MFLFGNGVLFTSPIQSNGSLGSPIPFGTLQDVTVDVKVEMKELWGAHRFPDTVADGKGSIDITAKAARINAAQFAQAFGGATTSQGGGIQSVVDEQHTVTATTITLANTPATGGVIPSPVVTAVINGVQVVYTIVPSGPVAGVSCTVSGATITFASGDNNVLVSVSYFYTVTSNNAFTVTLANPLVSSATFFSVALSKLSNSPGSNNLSNLILLLNRALAPGMKFEFKLDDFVIPDFQMKAFADGNNNIGTLYTVN